MKKINYPRSVYDNQKNCFVTFNRRNQYINYLTNKKEKLKESHNYKRAFEEWEILKEYYINKGFSKSAALEKIASQYGVCRNTINYHLNKVPKE